MVQAETPLPSHSGPQHWALSEPAGCAAAPFLAQGHQVQQGHAQARSSYTCSVSSTALGVRFKGNEPKEGLKPLAVDGVLAQVITIAKRISGGTRKP
jgi:hypothetical protein